MPKIRPVSDLRNYPEVLDEVHENSPVYLTKNGRGDKVIISMEDYELFEKLKESYLYIYRAEESKRIAEKEGWLTEEEVFKELN